MTRDQFAKAYQEGFTSTIKFLVSTGVPPDAAEEVAQAAWVRGWERRTQLRRPSKIVSWINRISLNMFRNWLRRQRPTDTLGDVPTPARPNAVVIDIRNGMRKCKPADQKLLRSYYLDGYTSNEMARLLGCSPEAVRVRVLRAKRHLRGELEALRAGPKAA